VTAHQQTVLTSRCSYFAAAKPSSSSQQPPAMQSLNDDDSLTYSLSDESIDSKGGGDFYFSSTPSLDFTWKKTKKRLNEVNKENETNSNEGNNERMKTLPSTTMKVPPLQQFTTLKETAIFFVCPQ
jgi:hypothetical protein